MTPPAFRLLTVKVTPFPLTVTLTPDDVSTTPPRLPPLSTSVTVMNCAALGPLFVTVSV
jgi:hypothetical protein